MLQVGIVGLPNVGKSTLFNALLRRQQALVANYSFATIEPNIGIVPVPDERLDQVALITKNEEKMEYLPPIVPATVQFVDIAGLVKGAAEGAGLGNKFLSHIREVDLIAQVVRSFPDADVIREGSDNPKSDIDTINTELILADMQTLSKQDINMKTPPKKVSALEKLRTALDKGKLASEAGLSDEEFEEIKSLQLLTFKKMIFILNVNTTTDWKQAIEVANELNKNEGRKVCVVDAKLEAELAALSADEQEEYLASLGITDSGINQLIKLSYEALNLISYLTSGVKEVRAWTIGRGMKAPAAAGVIHTDFEKGFIKAEVVDFSDFVRYNGWQGSRAVGKVRVEGKDYIVKDGDVVEFKVNA